MSQLSPQARLALILELYPLDPRCNAHRDNPASVEGCRHCSLRVRANAEVEEMRKNQEKTDK